MTEVRLFSFYDEKAAAFLTPFSAPTRAHALRSFQDAVADEATLFSRHPEDFVLYEVGVFDLAKGTIGPCQSTVATGTNVKAYLEKVRNGDA